MPLNGLFCADVPLRNYSLTHRCHFNTSVSAPMVSSPEIFLMVSKIAKMVLGLL